mmetsp:Transcript_35243/g.99362  ORF Transcript_35243/g.99362 Transcript_35243/m.99362 type:complete len:244 (-) Transcript_35243:419-1150(-)
MRYPTERGPTTGASPGSPRWTVLPPPRPILTTSGERKLVRTPPSNTTDDARRGKPLSRAPASVVLPPTSSTTALATLVRNEAPRILLVGPLVVKNMGDVAAAVAPTMVPSLRVTKSGQRRPQPERETRKARTVLRASGRRAAFRTDALSRSRNPSWPTSCDRTRSSGRWAFAKMPAITFPAASSCSDRSGEKHPTTATCVTPLATISFAADSTSAGSSAPASLPSNSSPPRRKYTGPSTAVRR